MPCIYCIHLVFGSFGSLLRRNKYSASCFRTPIQLVSSNVKQLPEKEFLQKTAVYCSIISQQFCNNYKLKFELFIPAVLISIMVAIDTARWRVNSALSPSNSSFNVSMNNFFQRAKCAGN